MLATLPILGTRSKKSTTSSCSQSDLIFKQIPIDSITNNPNQPRTIFDEIKLKELAASIEVHGVLEPVLVTPIDGLNQYELIAGERRVRAAAIAGLSTIPAIIRSPESSLELSLLENLQRENLAAIEQARAVKRLKELQNLTEIQLAQLLGMSRSNVNILLALNNLPECIQEECQKSGNAPKSLLYEIVTMKSSEEMLEAWEAHKRGELRTPQARKCKKKKKVNRAKPYVFTATSSSYKLTLQFKRSKVSHKEIINALQEEVMKLLQT